METLTPNKEEKKAGSRIDLEHAQIYIVPEPVLYRGERSTPLAQS